MSNEKDFVIEKGVLTKYTGPGGDVVIPDGVTRIGVSAFFWCKNMQSVTIPDSVISIGKQAFFGCTKLQSLSLPDTVTSIDDSAFSLCTNLRSLTIPASVTSIGESVFFNCFNLRQLVILNGDIIIGNKAFDGCDNVEIIATDIEYAVFKSIGAALPASMGYLNHSELYTNQQIVQEYQKSIFSQKKKLLPKIFKTDSVKALEHFAVAKKLTVKNIDTDFIDPAAEANATQCLAYLLDWKNRNIFATDMEKLIEREFSKDPYNATDMKKLWSYKKLENGTYAIASYKGDTCEIYIPERIGKIAVTAIAREAFCPPLHNNKVLSDVLENLTAVTIPKSVTSIGDKAFCRCENLKSVTIAEGVTTIGDEAFSECTNLQSITLPNSVTSIGWLAFSECTNLQSITIPDSVTNIGQSAFSSCENLQSITIPNSVTTIDERTFWGCKKLQSITIPDSVTRISDWAFKGCESLTSINIPGSVTSIDNSAFEGCNSLTSITIPASVKKIGVDAFWNCRELTIYSEAGSYAEEYAKEMGIAFEAL